jgi:hypothetical protein
LPDGVNGDDIDAPAMAQNASTNEVKIIVSRSLMLTKQH